MILALGLTSLVLVAVAMAIDIHLRMVDVNRTGVEEAQLARTLLDRMADDLRNAVLYKPVDVDKLVGQVVSQMESAVGGSVEGPSDEATAALKEFLGEELGGAEGSETDATSDSAESTVYQTVPGLYGNGYQLQVDTSRLPRGDELQALFSAQSSMVTNVAADVKTVVYYVLGGQVGGQVGGSAYALGASGTGNGLVRLEYDRAAMAWAAAQGQLIEMEQDAEPIAPEVAAIEFLYYDGTTSVEEWDSSERGGLPVAVEIALGIIPARKRNDTESTSLLSGTQPSLAENSDLLVFRRMVYLPVAQPTTEGSASSTSGTSSADAWEGFDSGSTGGSTGGSSSGG